MIKKRVCLLILDGFGEGEENISNPSRFAKLPNLNYFRKYYPFCLLSASGISVGLPYDQPGNCELGHLTMGTGVVYYQNYPRINLALERDELSRNEKLLKIFQHCRHFQSRLHLVGLLSESVSKTDINHLDALLDLANQQNLSRVYLHLFTDGLDSPPKSALNLIQKLQEKIREKKYSAKIASLCGRFYALDETQDYLFKTQKVFLLIVEGKGLKVTDPIAFLKEKYQQPNFNDSLLEPIFLEDDGFVKDNDALLFFHFENKSIFQLANAFLNPDFKEFKRPSRKNLLIASLTRYLNLDYPVIFEEQKILTNLTRVLAENKLKQLKLTDISKENILKYYFNGFITEEHPGEIYKIFPAFELPQEKLIQQTKEFFDALTLTLQEGDFDFILANLPTFDIVGHQGDFQLAIYFLEKVDEFLGQIYKILIKTNYVLLITSDHGNIEKMVNPQTGQKDTFHNLSPVPFYLIAEERKKEKTKEELAFYNKKILGSLVDVAPTILEIFNLPSVREFEGKSLLRYF